MTKTELELIAALETLTDFIEELAAELPVDEPIVAAAEEFVKLSRASVVAYRKPRRKKVRQ